MTPRPRPTNTGFNFRNPENRVTLGYSQEQLHDGLVALGVQQGDRLFVHSSFKKLGDLANGAATIVASLEQAVGPSGLIMMPSFNLVPKAQRAATWNVQTTPSTVGWLSEYFRLMPGTHRSDHYSHSVAARGWNAAALVAGHRDSEGLDSPWDLEPWGKTYGINSPMIRALDLDAKVLLLGVDYHCVTYAHVVEVMHWNQSRRLDPQAAYTWFNRDRLGGFFESEGHVRIGRVGDAECRLFSAKRFVSLLVAAVGRDPKPWING